MAARKPAKSSSKKSAAKSAKPASKAAKKAAPAKAVAAAPVEFTEEPAPSAKTAPPAAPPTMAGVPYPQTPVLETPMAAVVLIANIIIPGLGTLIAGIIGHQKLIGRAVAQFLLLFALGAGLVWAVITGVQALINASWGNKNPQSRSS